MGRIFWPTEFQTRRSGWILIGRIAHWSLTAVALCLVGLTVVISAMLIEASQDEGGLWRDPAVLVTFVGSIGGIGVYLLGRTLRFALARE